MLAPIRGISLSVVTQVATPRESHFLRNTRATNELMGHPNRDIATRPSEMLRPVKRSVALDSADSNFKGGYHMVGSSDGVLVGDNITPLLHKHHLWTRTPHIGSLRGLAPLVIA